MSDMYTIQLGDARLLLPQVTPGSVNLLVTDPPYRLTQGGKYRPREGFKPMGGIFGSQYENKGLLFDVPSFDEWLALVYQSLASNADAYVMVNDKNIQEALNEATRVGFKLHKVLVWDKGTATPSRWYMQSVEFILYLWKGKAKAIRNKGDKAIQRQKNDVTAKVHPTGKPIELVERFIINSSEPGEVVMNPFMGSGPVGVAAIKNGRKFVGFESDPKWYAVAAQRLHNETSRQRDIS